MKTRTRRIVASLVAFSMVASQTIQVAQAATTSLATSPLANSTSSVVKPNIMYVLDNSGSMAWDFTPDYVNDSESPTAHTWGMCWGTSGTVTGTKTSTGTACQAGNGGSPNDTNVSQCCNSADDMPWATASINYQTYDPAVRYQPPVDYQVPAQSYTNSNPTAAKPDGFSSSGSTTNLTTSWPHQVWCTTSTATPTVADPTGGGKCLENQDTGSGTLYPDATHVFLKNYNGPPYYFVMRPSEYCTDSTLTNCVRSPSSTSVSGVAFNTPAYFRWCATYDTTTHTFGGCQGVRDQSHYIPNYLGGWAQNGSLGSYATATLQVKSVTNGQSIQGITIGGTNVVGSSTFAATVPGDTQASISAAVCSAINANSAGSGYTCAASPTFAATLLTGAEDGKVFQIVSAGTTNWISLGASSNAVGTVFTKANGNTGTGTGTARRYDTVILKSASVGTAPNGQQVLVAGPAPTTPINATGSITISNPPLNGYKITGVAIQQGASPDPSDLQLITTTITSGGSTDATAQDLCNAINAYTPTSGYSARYGSASWGTCNATSATLGTVEVRRNTLDSSDNGKQIVVTGPVTTTQYSGTITVTSTTGQARIDDIKQGTTSILSSKPLLYADGTATSSIAIDIASKINTATGCSASVSGNVVSIQGSGSCTGALSVTGSAVAATGKFRVSSLGNTHAGDLGAIQVTSTSGTTTNIVGHITSSQITDNSAVSANATTLKNAVGNGFSAATPVVNGASYDVTVTAPTGGAYNGQSFNFLAGTPTSGTSGTAPQWTFPITGATTDSRKISSITCAGTNTITTATATTGVGASPNIDYINNLTVTAASHLNGRSDGTSGYSYTNCTTATSGTPYSTCTIQGPAGSNANTSLYLTLPFTNGITISGCSQSSCNAGANQCCTISSAQTTAGTNGSNPTWTFDITNATADNLRINSIECPAGSNRLATTPTTGIYDYIRINNLRTSLASNGRNSFSTSCTPAATAGSLSTTCTVTGPSSASCANLAISKDASITLSTTSPAKVLSGGSAPTWTFPVEGAAYGGTMGNITCGSDVVTNGTARVNVSGTSSATKLAAEIQAQQTSRGGSNLWSTGNGSCTTSGTTVQCNLARSSGSGNRCAGNAITVTPRAGDGLTVAFPANPKGGASSEYYDGSRYWYYFTVSPVPSDSTERVISSISCSGATSDVAAVQASSYGSGTSNGTRVDNITKNTPTNNLQALDAASGTSGYTVSCANFSTASGTTGGQADCTVTGPVGAAKCTTLGFASVSGVTLGTQARTAAGSDSIPTWSFNITGANADNKAITAMTCTGVDTINTSVTTPVSTVSTGTGATTATYISSLTSSTSPGLTSAGAGSGGYSYSCTTSGMTAPQQRCTMTGPTGVAACATPTITTDSGITIANKTQTSAGAAASSPLWQFSVTDAATPNININRIRIGNSASTTTSFNEASPPTTGTSSAGLTVWGRINNLTQTNPTGLQYIGQNGYSYSCTTASSGTPQSTCTVTGPVGAAACNVTDFVITPQDSTITIGTKTRTNAGSAAGVAVDDFAPALSTVSAFSGGYAVQGTSVSGLASVTTGTIATTASTMSGGAASNPLTIPTNASGISPDVLVMTGGTGPTGSNNWIGIGSFKRYDIISGNTFSRGTNRSDCAGTTCTYTEELQNFANWYSYYRTRNLAMKSATSLAFKSLNNSFRVGFDDICNCSSGTCSTSVKLGAAEFSDSGEVANQRKSWWSQLTGSTPSCSTPLRGEAAKIGRYYAGKLSGTDPVTYSCQQNFILLVTDGYWNEGEGSSIKKVDGTDIGNVDNSLTSAPRPYYDGAMASTTCPSGTGVRSGASSCRTLADVAQYYYTTDLRSTAVVTANTAAPHNMNSGSTYPITGATPTGYNGSVIVNVVSPTQFTYETAGGTTVGAYSPNTASVNGVTISSASCCTGFGNGFNSVSSQNVATNNVPTTASDNMSSQHMTFFAMGLGISGFLHYDPNYESQASGDYYDIKNGLRNWPAVANLDPSAVDDLWHAAVNGRGKYFSATNPTSVVNGLTDALNKIGARVGAGAAAATSNLEPVAGDNFAFLASYVTTEWVGDLQARTIDTNTGQISPDTNCGATGSGCLWSAQFKLDNSAFAARRIFLAPISNLSGDAFRLFDYANLSGAEQAYFDGSNLSQYSALHTDPNFTPGNLVDFLRGDRSLEQDSPPNVQLWRKRTHVLGDFVNTQPLYVKAPNFTYQDAGYSAYKKTGTAANRRPVVYISGNDGMLHAFNADTNDVVVSGATVPPGGEMWAYIPKQSLSIMSNLADMNYSHRYFVDGTITIGDVDFGNGTGLWHTILVGGLRGGDIVNGSGTVIGRSGGKSYYAIDITDPINPKYLWEFTDPNMGYTYGNASINKLPSISSGGSKWAVFFTSGYNNANGIGYLWAVDPKTGAIFNNSNSSYNFPLSTASGTATTPSNLGKISAFVTDPIRDNTAEYIYAGDLSGDLWRFDLASSNNGHTGIDVFKLAHLTDASNVAEPITTRPELTKLTDGTRVIYAGTGKYLGITDISNTQVQAIYAIKDTLGAQNLDATGLQETLYPRASQKTVDISGTPTFVNAFLPRKMLATDDAGNPITATAPSGATVPARAICPGTAPTVDHSTGLCANVNVPDMDWGKYDGWYADFPSAGERMNVDMNLVLGALIVPTNVPASSACTSGGSSFLSALDYKTGLAFGTNTIKASTENAGALIVGITTMIIAGNLVASANFSNNTNLASNVGATPLQIGGKHSLWREFETSY